MGVSEPPTLLTIKMKKTTWKGFIRDLFSRIKGLIKSIEAPVVPIPLANMAPKTNSPTLIIGLL